MRLTTASRKLSSAYVLYRRGREEQYNPLTAQSIAQALDWFRQSLEIDPEYAAAHAGICLAYSSGFKIVDDSTYIDKAKESCATALALNPNLNIVHNALGDLYLETGEHREAEASYQRALAINANDASALTGLAAVYADQQKLTQAEESLREAIAMQPGNWQSYRALGRFYYGNGRYADATAAFKEVVPVRPKPAPISFTLIRGPFLLFVIGGWVSRIDAKIDRIRLVRLRIHLVRLRIHDPKMSLC